MEEHWVEVLYRGHKDMSAVYITVRMSMSENGGVNAIKNGNWCK